MKNFTVKDHYKHFVDDFKKQEDAESDIDRKAALTALRTSLEATMATVEDPDMDFSTEQ